MLVLTVLKQRNHRMEKLQFYFCRQKVTEAAKNNFRLVIKTGKGLLKALKIRAIREAKIEIESYLIACEEAILAVAIEIRSEFCDIVELLDDFRDERLLLMKFVDGELDEEMFR